MRLIKSILLGSVAGVVGIAAAQAADLPTRKSAPIEYVRICDAYGAGFFYIPGTDTCLKVGGLVLAEARTFNQNFNLTLPYAGNGSGTATAKGTATNLSLAGYQNARNRDTFGMAALGRVELDARNATAWGTLRAFVRVDAYYGAGSTASTGSFGQSLGGNGVTTTSAASPSRYTTILNKAFIQFAGMTAGYAQSMFDFYADAYNFEGLRGSNATAALFAYTATFGGGFSATISAEDPQSRRTMVGNVITTGASFGIPAATAVGAGALTATDAGERLPDVVANLRVDQPWGAVQASGAFHQSRSTLYPSGATGAVFGAAATLPQYPVASANSNGFAAQLGVQFNLDMLAPGDKLWLQAGYESGAMSYIDGSNLTFASGAVNANRYPGATTPTYSDGWAHGADYDCVWTYSGTCERQHGYAVVAAFKHYWMPTLASAVFGSFMRMNYSANSTTTPAGTGVGMVSWQETRIGTNLIWTPVRGFDIGGEFMYMRNTNLVGSNPLAQLNNPGYGTGLPGWTATQNVYEGRLRVQRAF